MTDYLHDAFISYSRKDQPFARMLERELENYRPPGGLGLPANRPDIFLDVEDFTGSAYFESVEKHLSASKKLIVLCSPHARRSEFVNDEIRRFVQSRGGAAKDFIPIMIGGLPNNEAETGGQEGQKAFPEELSKAVEMPLAADYRRFNVEKDKVHKGAFSGDWYKILADLYEVSRSAIEQRERKRAARARLISVSIAVAVFILLSVALVYALIQRSTAVEQRDKAEVALTRSLVNSSQGQLSTNKVVNDLASVLSALKASRQLAGLPMSPQGLRSEVWGALHQSVYGIRERNRIQLDARIHSAALSTDGSRVAALSEDGRIRLWDRDGKPTTEFQGPAGKMHLGGAGFTSDLGRLVTLQSALSPEGYILSDQNRVIVWDLQARRQIAEIGPLDASIWDVAMHPFGKFIATAGDDGLRVWDQQGQVHAEYGPFPERAVSVDFSPDGSKLAWGSDAGVRVLDLTNPGPVVSVIARRDSSQHASTEVYVDFLPDSKMVAVAGQLWDLTPQMRGQVKGTVFSPDGTLVGASSNQGYPQVFDRNGNLLAELRGHSEGAFVQAIHSDKLILTAGGDRTIRLWDISPHYTAEFKPWRTTFSMAMSDAAKVLATEETSYEPSGEPMPIIGRDNAVTLWDSHGSKLGEFPRKSGSRSSRIFLSPNAAHLVVAGPGGDVHLWDTQSRAKRTIQANDTEVIAVAFTSPEPQLVMKKGGSILLKDWVGTVKEFTLTDSPVSVMLDTAGTHLIAASQKGVAVWDLDGKRISSFEKTLNEDTVVLPGSGIERVAVSSNGRAIVLDAQGKVVADFGQAAAQALSPDGRLLATSGGYYAVATLWEVDTRQPVARLQGNGDFEMRFSNDGKFISVVGNDVPARLWRIESLEELVSKACQQVAGYLRNSTALTDEERSLCRPSAVAAAPAK